MYLPIFWCDEESPFYIVEFRWWNWELNKRIDRSLWAKCVIAALVLPGSGAVCHKEYGRSLILKRTALPTKLYSSDSPSNRGVVHACSWHHAARGLRSSRWYGSSSGLDAGRWATACCRWRLHAERFPLDIVHCTVQIRQYSSTAVVGCTVLYALNPRYVGGVGARHPRVPRPAARLRRPQPRLLPRAHA
jgi:hypothetical protein